MKKTFGTTGWRVGAASAACMVAAALMLSSMPVALAQSADSAARTLTLAVGEQRSVSPSGALERVAIGDPAVADVLSVKGGQVLLFGKAAGTTSLLMWTRGSSVPQRFAINVTTRAARALLGGDSPNVRVLDGVAVISGSSPNMEQHQREVVAAAADARKGSVPLDVSTVATSPVVQVDVRVVEFSRQVLKDIGFNFFKQNNNGFSFGSLAPSSTGATTTTGSGGTASLPSPISSAFSLVFNSASHGLSSNLSLMEANNLAHVLAEPTLVALSGQTASFLAGGEIPIPQSAGLGSTSIVYKQYGIGLTVTPTVLSPQRIALKVAPEASQLDYANAVTENGVSVPGLSTRRAETTVELGDGESFVIGGLIDRETASNVSKVPLLGDLPVIGAFFKELNYQQNDKELVIIVTPHLVRPLARNAKLPATPGELADERDGPVWRAVLGGALAKETVPGFAPGQDAMPGFAQ